MKLKTNLHNFLCLRTNRTRRGHILALGVHVLPFLRTPGADLREMFLKQLACEPELRFCNSHLKTSIGNLLR